MLLNFSRNPLVTVSVCKALNTPSVSSSGSIRLGHIGIHCDIVMLGNGSGTDFGASQCIQSNGAAAADACRSVCS